MSCIISDCVECKYIRQDENGEYSVCDAFPEGIPDAYYWGKINVREIDSCNNNIGFENRYHQSK